MENNEKTVTDNEKIEIRKEIDNVTNKIKLVNKDIYMLKK